MKKIITALFPGTFDPITYGHLDLVTRAAMLFERVVVVVAHNAGKKTLFSIDERCELIKQVVHHLPNVSVKITTGLIAEYAKQNNTSVLIRGVRTTNDFEYEHQMANMNRHLNPQLETLFLMPSHQNAFISSSLVKDVVRLGGDLNKFLPEPVIVALQAKLNE